MADAAIMEKSHLVADLLKMKRDLVTKHADLLEQLNQTVKDLNAVSRVIEQCDKDAAYIPVFPPRPYKAYFAQGELLALIADALKAMPEGTTTMGDYGPHSGKAGSGGKRFAEEPQVRVRERLMPHTKREAPWCRPGVQTTASFGGWPSAVRSRRIRLRRPRSSRRFRPAM